MMNTDTRERILDAGQRLAQERGFSAFSYADIADAVGIRKPSIHHHFPSKEDLELALLERYNTRFTEALARIDRSISSPAERLKACGMLYKTSLEAQRICLGGMGASDIVALPTSLRVPLNEFFTQHTRWLAEVLDAGRRSGEFVFSGTPLRRAQTVLAILQGGLLMARAVKDESLFDTLLDDLLTGVGHR